MLNEDEKQAIETFTNLVNYLEKWNKILTVIPEDKKYYNTVLNLITKLQKENEEKDKTIEKYIKIYKEYDCYRWVKELEKKDKQIDLMGEVIFKKFKPQLVLEYGIENKEDFIKLFEEQSKEKGK